MEDDAIEAISHLLPDDLIICILLRLPAQSIARFRCVSKLWFSITTRPSFLFDHTHRSPISILIQTTKLQSNGYDLHVIDFKHLPPYIGHVLPERRRSTTDVIVASCDGLLCLIEECQVGIDNYKYVILRYYVLNLITGVTIDVPKPTNPSGSLLGFYFHPSTCEYRLIRRKYFNLRFEVELISLGGEAWRTIDCSSCSDLECIGHSIDLNGILYWIAYNAKECKASGIMGFDVIDEKFMLMPLPSKDMVFFANGNLFDMEKRLGLSIINGEHSPVNGLMIGIWVMKDTVEWEKMYSLSCFHGLGIDLRIASLVCIWKEEIIFLFYGPHLYLVRFDLKSMDYCAVQVDSPMSFIWGCGFLCKESLISYDSFLIS